jgi:hypothetical protein
MSILVVGVANEHHTCEKPEQSIEVYPASGNNVLVKCICPRKLAAMKTP